MLSYMLLTGSLYYKKESYKKLNKLLKQTNKNNSISIKQTKDNLKEKPKPM